MYEYIKGKLIEVDTQRAIIDVNGVGYKVFIPASIYQDLIDKDQITLHTSYIVKEDSQTLFGFLTKLQRNVFEMLKKQNHFITFTSGLEAKILKDWHVNLLSQLRLKRVFFAYDTPDDFEYLINA
ncbi:hypothetical protein LCGC14_2920970, partial [marine sediment metagenome]